jgi:hypothetical protein
MKKMYMGRKQKKIKAEKHKITSNHVPYVGWIIKM